jgi:hypothetical protein
VGRVLFTPKVEPTKAGPAKAKPAIDWSEVESRLQEISAPAHLSPDAAIEHSVTLANDPPALNLPEEIENQLATIEPLANDPPAAIDRPVPPPRDPFEMLSLLAAIPTNRS